MTVAEKGAMKAHLGVFVLAGLLAGACADSPPQLANPASVNCTEKGGKLLMASKPGGAYGICIFEDNRQCEEWALMRGQCPVGGMKVTGYTTEAAVYCAITGGAYRVTAQAANDRPEYGVCTLPGGPTCDAVAYYAGSCPARS